MALSRISRDDSGAFHVGPAVNRNINEKRRAHLRRAVDRHASTVSLGHGFHKRQADAPSFARRGVIADEEFEDLIAPTGRDGLSLVMDREHHAAAGLLRHDFNDAAVAVFDRVVDQIFDRPAHRALIPMPRHRLAIDLKIDAAVGKLRVLIANFRGKREHVKTG